MNFLNKKRSSDSKICYKDICKGKKFNFIASKKSRNNKANKKEVEKITGKNLLFKYRKEKAIELMTVLKDKKSKNIELDEIKENIKNCLNFDNTNISLIYDCLSLLNKYDDKTEISNLLYKYRFCLANSVKLENKNINFAKDFPQNNKIFMFESQVQLTDRFFNSLNNLYHIYQEIQKLDQEKYVQKEKVKILTYKIRKLKGNMKTMYKKDKCDNENINKINEYSFDFLNDYLPIKEFNYFVENQPINFKDNNILFIIYIYHKLFEHMVEVKSKGKSLTILEYKLKKIYELKLYWNNIYDLYCKEKIITDEMSYKLELLMFFLDSKAANIDLNVAIKGIISKEKSLSLAEVEKFIKENNNKNGKEMYLEKNNLCVKYDGKVFKYEYKNYTKYLLESILVSDSDLLLEQLKWNFMSLIDFFDENDKIYLKKLLKEIVKSKLFKEIWKNYSDVDDIVDYFFNEEENIDFLLNNIYFIPYVENHFGIQAITTNNLKILTSSYSISQINTSIDYINYKILELARKVIIITHEICHYLKRALFLITNGIISRTTRTNILQSGNIEAGKMFEEVIFDWDYEKKSNKKRTKSHNKKRDEKITYNEENYKMMGLEKALKILNSNFYEKSINEFRNDLNNNKYYDKNDISDTLKEYVESIGFDLENFLNNKNLYKIYTINCARNGPSSYSILYNSDDHSYLTDKYLKDAFLFESEEDENI